MKEDSIFLEKNSLKEPMSYPAYSINSGNTSRKRRKFCLNFDINNSEIKDTFDEYYLRNIEIENNNNNNHPESVSNFKLFNLSDISNFEYKISEKKNKQKEKEKKENDKSSIIKFGRKRKDSSEKGVHNKYSSDNVIRKCKSVLIQIISSFINNKIKEIYGNDSNYRPKINRLMKMNHFQVMNSNVKFNQQFLYRQLKDIFSEKTSAKCTRFSEDHNRQLINSLLNDEDKIKKKLFSDILNLTFLDCIQHFRGSKTIPCLCDLKNYDEVCDELEGDEYYKESFRCYIDNFEKIIKNKKSRRNFKHKKDI